MKKIIVLLLALTMLLPVMAACKDNNNTPEDTTAPPAESFKLTEDLLSLYTIIAPENCGTEINKHINELKEYIKETTGAELPLKDDFVKEGSDTFKVGEYEILVGNTNRAETEVLYKKLRIKDYGYALINKKVVIFGHSDAYVKKAVGLFCLNILDNYTDSSEYLMQDGTQDIKYGKYDAESITLNQTDISNYSVVYPSGFTNREDITALSFCDYIKATSGYVLKCHSDRSPYDGGYEIQIGDTNRVTDAMKSIKTESGTNDSEAYIQKQGNIVWLSGSNRISIESAKSNLLALIENEKDANKAITIPESAKHSIKSQPLNVLFYNVRFDFETDKRNPDDVIVSIKQQNPDIFGTNETTPAWLTKLKTAFDSEYTCIPGEPVDTSDDASHDSIFFKTADFELIENGTKWMSDTPDKVSKFSLSKHYVTFTYAVLKHRTSGIEFLYVTTHLVNDSTTPEQNRQARVLQAGVMLSFIENYSNLPIIVGGDFNASFKGDGPKQMNDSLVFSNAYDIADTGILDGGTFVYNTNSEGLNDAYTRRSDAVLDHIFVTEGSIKVQKFEAVNNIMNGKYPSDHLPVTAQITIYR